MNKIFVTGDTHGMLDFNKLVNFCLVNECDRSDHIIIAGDCGVVWSQESLSDYISKFESLGVTILFVDGNHENFDMLYDYPVTTFCGGKVHKISDNIYHLIRGEIFDIYDKKILAIGGGESNDVSGRIEHKTWWSEERIAAKEFDNAINNLSVIGNCVDYVVSHMPPTEVLPTIEKELTCCGEELPWYIVPKLVPRISNDYLQKIANITDFKRWFCGHIHVDMNLGQYTCVYDRIVEIK